METSDSDLKKDPTLLSLRAIESALKLVESKKQALKDSFRQLESHPSSNFIAFSWPDLNSHFSSIHDSLSLRFRNLLQSYDSTPEPRSLSSLFHFSELNAICNKMDVHAMRDYIIACLRDPFAIQSELSNSLRSAPDPAMLILNAVESFDTLTNKEKQACVLILEAFVKSKPEGLKEESRRRAKSLGEEWLQCVIPNRGPTPLVRAVLNLIAGFHLAKEMDVEKLVSCFAAASCSSSSPHLLKMADLDSAAIASLVNKLVKEGKHMYAVRYVCELKLTEKFHPEEILKTYFNEVKSPSLFNETSKEIIDLELAIKLIKTYRLSYPISEVEQRIAILKRGKRGRPERQPETGNTRRWPSTEPKTRPFRGGQENAYGGNGNAGQWEIDAWGYGCHQRY